MIEIISDIRETIETDEAGIPRTLPSKDRDEDEDANEDDEDFPASPATKRIRMELSHAKREEREEETARLSMETTLTQLKCLTICRYMLERSEENLRDNSSMYGLLHELIIPAVQSMESELREEGVHCLGLCCMLDQALAFQNVQLFVHCLKTGNEDLQQKALMIVFDILMAYGYNVVVSKLSEPNDIPKMFATCLEQYDVPGMQAIAVEGISKLMLSKMLRDEELLKQLVLLYFDPDTADNLKLRQCLSYFLPMYCHSSQDNQVLMQKILVPTILSLIQTHHDLSKGQEMVAPPQIIQMMVDWTDPRRVVSPRLNPDAAKTIDLGLHAEVAIEVLKALFIETVAATRKLLVQILNKLYIEEAGEMRLKKLTLLAGNLKSRKPLTDAMTRNMFNKFEAALLKFFGNKPEALDDDEMAQAEEFKEVLDFVESVEDVRMLWFCMSFEHSLWLHAQNTLSLLARHRQEPLETGPLRPWLSKRLAYWTAPKTRKRTRKRMVTRKRNKIRDKTRDRTRYMTKGRKKSRKRRTMNKLILNIYLRLWFFVDCIKDNRFEGTAF